MVPKERSFTDCMRVVISCDMEGISGITKWEQVHAGSTLYEECRLLYTEEVNAAVRGAKKAGYKEIIVIDGHGAGGGYSFNSLLQDRLEAEAEYIFGSHWASLSQPLLSGCNAVMLLGAHAKTGTPDGVLCHTMSSQSCLNIFINGTPVGESSIIAALAASFDIPTIFISGDEAACDEARAFIGSGLYAAQVKRGLNQCAACCLSPIDARALIEKTVYTALKHPKTWAKPVSIKAPIELKIEFSNQEIATNYAQKTGCTLLNSRTIVCRGDNFFEVWNSFWQT
jgi:D-amino peptidase